VKSISSRITLWYAVTVITTLACLFVAGHYLLENQLIHQLDKLNETQFKQLKFSLGPNYQTLTASTIDDRIREVTESASSLFYIDCHGPMTNRFFQVQQPARADDSGHPRQARLYGGCERHRRAAGGGIHSAAP